RLPSFTLFPYTTLFRSIDQEFKQRQLHRRRGHFLKLDPRMFVYLKGIAAYLLRMAIQQLEQSQHIVFFAFIEIIVEGLIRQYLADRKSTRLNSSHVKIS